PDLLTQLPDRGHDPGRTMIVDARLDMRCAHNAANAIRMRDTRHFERGGEIGRPVVHSRQQMAMQIDHEPSACGGPAPRKALPACWIFGRTPPRSPGAGPAWRPSRAGGRLPGAERSPDTRAEANRSGEDRRRQAKMR